MRKPGTGSNRGGSPLRNIGAGRRRRGRRERVDRADSRRARRQDSGDREKAGIDLSKSTIVDAPHSHAAAAKAVELVRQGTAELLMKGSLHTDELLGAVVARETGLRTGRRISHVFIMDVPTYHKVLIVTDAAINIAPDPRGQGRHLPERHRSGRVAWVWKSPRWPFSPRSKR